MEDNIKLGLEYTPFVWTLVVFGVFVIIYLIYSMIKHPKDVNISLRNVLRNKRRSLLTLSAVIFAFAGSVLLGNYFLDMFVGLRESTIRSQTGHIQIQKNGYKTYGGSAPTEYLITNYEEILQKIYADPELKSLIKLDMKELTYNGVLSSSSGERSLAYLGRGVDSKQDKIIAVFDTYISGSSLQEDKFEGIVLGEGLANQLQVQDEDIVTVLGTTSDGGINVLDAEIIGVVKPFSSSYGNVLLKSNLSFAQEMIASDGINKLTFLLYDTYDTSLVKAKLHSILSAHPEWDAVVYDWYDLEEFYSQVYNMFTTIFIVVSSLLFALVLFLVLNTMTMSIFERFSEFGTLRSIGLKRKKLISLVFLEGAILGIIGTVLGVVVTWILGILITLLHIELPPPPGSSKGYPLSLVLQFNEQGYITLIVVSLLSIIGITALSSLFPAMRASKLKIIDALRHN